MVVCEEELESTKVQLKETKDELTDFKKKYYDLVR